MKNTVDMIYEVRIYHDTVLFYSHIFSDENKALCDLRFKIADNPDTHCKVSMLKNIDGDYQFQEVIYQLWNK